MGTQLGSGFIRPFLAGLFYALVWLACGAGTKRLIRRYESRKRTKLTNRVVLADWHWWEQLVLLLASLGLLYLWLANGTLDIGDVGLGRIEMDMAGRLFPVLGISFGLTCLFWIWVLQPEGTVIRRPCRVSLGYTDLLARGLTRESGLAILRGAMIPLVGRYWGIWLAVVLLGAIALSQSRSRLTASVSRKWSFVQLGLDWIGSALFYYMASAWPGIVVRLLSLILLRISSSLWICLYLRCRQT